MTSEQTTSVADSLDRAVPSEPSSLPVAIAIAFYSFGTFGFLNLFGLRTAAQVVVGIMLVAAVGAVRRSALRSTATMAGIFFFVYAVGGLYHNGAWGFPVEAAFAMGVWILITVASYRQVVVTARTLVVMTAVSTMGLAIAYGGYLWHPEWLDRANFEIYDSTVGAARVFPGFPLDYLSFTSGDGFVIGANVLPRLKGYSNEPSATVVHYLAPAVLALFLSRRYRWLGLFVLLVNVVAIASVTTYVVLAITAVLLVWFYLFRWASTLGVVVGGMLFVFFMLNGTAVTQFQSAMGERAIEIANFDLLARKAGSLMVRQEGLASGLPRVLAEPLGWSGVESIAGAGLLLIVSAYAGWIGLSILIGWCVSAGRLAINYASRRASLRSRAASAFFLAMLFVMLFVSGYGWNRVPGAIVLAIMYRLMEGDDAGNAPVASVT